METEHKVTAMRANGIVPYSLDELFLTLHDSSSRQIYDSDIDVSETLKKVAANTYYVYEKSKAMMFVSARDFIYVHYNHRVSFTLIPD